VYSGSFGARLYCAMPPYNSFADEGVNTAVIPAEKYYMEMS